MPRTRMALIGALVFGMASIADAQGRGNQGRGNGRNRQATSAENLRFAAMDTNRDGRITRAEWRGSAQSFTVHDWNNDGVLSGDEVRPGGQRAGRNAAEPQFDSPYREYEFADWTARGFTNLDHNRDGRLTSEEWHFDRESFRRVDHNRDGALSRAEFLNEGREDDDRDDRFSNLDVNSDGLVDRNEWHGTSQRYAALDENRDGMLSRREMIGTEPPTDLFTSLDVDRDRAISRSEWHWQAADFTRRDANRDGRLSRSEFEGAATVESRSAAYRAGYNRGITDGRAAGREDRERRQEWDIEGQREMQSADAGYVANLGSRQEYQAGYREGFRRAYPEGFRGQ